MQDEFFDNVINNRHSKHRYYSIVESKETRYGTGLEMEFEYKNVFVGMAGLTNIEWENGTAEISLIINPDYRGKGKGSEAVDLLKHEAIYNMRLSSLYGEVYDCGNRGFWEKVVKRLGGYKTDLINRKYWNGEMYGSLWFSI